jgi:hypothetical protein
MRYPRRTVGEPTDGEQTMIEKLSQSDAHAFGLKVEGEVTADEVEQFVPQIEFFVRERKKRKVGLLVDLSELEHAGWKARWEELRFLKRYSDHIERVGVVGAGAWERMMGEILDGTVLLEAETRYFHKDEIQHAWHWVKHGEHDKSVPVRRIFPKENGLMGGYNPEYLDV